MNNQNVPNVAAASEPVLPKYMNYVIAGAAGMIAIIIFQPTDLLKTRMQLLGPAGKDMNFVTVAHDIYKKEGILGFYVGISAAMFRQCTYTASRLGIFNGLFDMYETNYGTPNFTQLVWLGIIAGGLGSFIGTPAEVTLIRMTADGRLPLEQRRNYKHVIDALARIVREEGVTTLWRGATITVSRAMVTNGAQLSSYTQFREMLLPSMGDGLLLHAVAALIAGIITTLASLPFDIVKTRIQDSEKGANIFTVFANVIWTEGVISLWSGLWPAYAKTGPATILIYIVLEKLNTLYFKYTAS